MDGNRTHPGRLSSAPQTVLKTAGGTSPRTSPAAESYSVSGMPMPSTPRGSAWRVSSPTRNPSTRSTDVVPAIVATSVGSGERKAPSLPSLRRGQSPRSGLHEGDPNFRVPLSGMDQRQRVLAPDLPGPDLLPVDSPLQGGQEALPARVLACIDRNLHARTIARFAPAASLDGAWVRPGSVPRAWPSARPSCSGGSHGPIRRLAVFEDDHRRD